jgi:hypothetical protein
MELGTSSAAGCLTPCSELPHRGMRYRIVAMVTMRAQGGLLTGAKPVLRRAFLLAMQPGDSPLWSLQRKFRYVSR